MLAASVQEGVQLVAALLHLGLACDESLRLQGTGEGDLVALGGAAVGSVAAEDGALEGGLVVHPPEGRRGGQVRGHVAHVVQVANVALHEDASGHGHQEAHEGRATGVHLESSRAGVTIFMRTDRLTCER